MNTVLRTGPIPPALEGRKPLAGGEGAQHREPPDPRLTNNALQRMRPGRAREIPVRSRTIHPPRPPAGAGSYVLHLPSLVRPRPIAPPPDHLLAQAATSWGAGTVFITLRVMRPLHAAPSAPLLPPPWKGERRIAGGEGAQQREPPDPAKPTTRYNGCALEGREKSSFPLDLSTPPRPPAGAGSYVLHLPSLVRPRPIHPAQATCWRRQLRPAPSQPRSPSTYRPSPRPPAGAGSYVLHLLSLVRPLHFNTAKNSPAAPERPPSQPPIEPTVLSPICHS